MEPVGYDDTLDPTDDGMGFDPVECDCMGDESCEACESPWTDEEYTILLGGQEAIDKAERERRSMFDAANARDAIERARELGRLQALCFLAEKALERDNPREALHYMRQRIGV